MRAALRAGSHVASSATPISVTVMAPKLSGSNAPTPCSWLRSRLLTMAAPSREAELAGLEPGNRLLQVNGKKRSLVGRARRA